MAVLVPDIVICNTINLALDAIRVDYRSRVDLNQEDQSILYLLFYGQSLGNYNLYLNTIKLVDTTAQDLGKHIEAKLGYDHSSSQSPAIYVTLPSENDRNNSSSIGEGDQDELVLGSNEDEYRTQFTRRYSSTYNIIIVCENKNEMSALYNLIKELLVTCTNHLMMKGIENIKIGGQDIQFVQMQDKMFRRAITLNFEYEQSVPELVVKTIYSKLRLSWQPQGSDQPVGSIEITTDDSEQS